MKKPLHYWLDYQNGDDQGIIENIVELEDTLIDAFENWELDDNEFTTKEIIQITLTAKDFFHSFNWIDDGVIMAMICQGVEA